MAIVYFWGKGEKNDQWTKSVFLREGEEKLLRAQRETKIYFMEGEKLTKSAKSTKSLFFWMLGRKITSLGFYKEGLWRVSKVPRAPVWLWFLYFEF